MPFSKADSKDKLSFLTTKCFSLKLSQKNVKRIMFQPYLKNCLYFKAKTLTYYSQGFVVSINTAATYSPGWNTSTIGHEGLNFSVRYGKR